MKASEVFDIILLTNTLWEIYVKVIICIDDEGGMLFNGRRQSRDPVVSDDIISSIGDKRLLISPFSEKLFPNEKRVKICKNPLSRAKSEDFCFIENLPLLPYIDEINTVIVYKWNRLYPTDKFLDIPLSDGSFKLCETSEMVGVSHEKITKEIYKR